MWWICLGPVESCFESFFEHFQLIHYHLMMCHTSSLYSEMYNTTKLYLIDMGNPPLHLLVIYDLYTIQFQSIQEKYSKIIIDYKAVMNVPALSTCILPFPTQHQIYPSN